MTAYKNMAFGLMLRKVPRKEIDRRVRETAAVLGIENLLDRKPTAMSGGQRQRVAVGRAIVRNPKAFLFDEPLSNLDAKLRVEMRAELKRLHRQIQTTTIYVTHDQEEAMTLGDRIVVMKDAIVQQVGSPLEVYDSPANRFVASFVGTPPMNFLTGRLVARDGAVYFDEGSAQLRLSDAQSVRLSPHAGKDVVLGVRPEAVGICPEGRFAGKDNGINVQVQVVEPLGEKMDLYASTPKHPHIVARVDADRNLQAGGAAVLFVDIRKVHVFACDAAGVNLSLSPEKA
jgi:multiple sugar transport system ATP-binding protein